MKNKPTTKALSLLLAVLMVVSTLATMFVTVASAEEVATVAESATTNKAHNLLKGIDFEDAVVTKDAATADKYLTNKAGIHLTTQNKDAAHGGLQIKDINGNKALFLGTDASYVNGNVDSAKNADKYAKSQDFLDLLFGTSGPKSFSLSMDMIFLDNDSTIGNAGNVNKTSDSGGKALTTFYRGSSAFSFTSYATNNVPFKVVSANLPVYSEKTVDGKTYAYIPDDAVIPNDDIGYLYPNANSVTRYIEETGDNKIKDYCSIGNGNDGKEGNATNGWISVSSMTDNPFLYKIGEPVTVKFDFVRDGSTMKFTTYIKGYDRTTGTQETEFRQLGSSLSYSLGADACWNFGLRLFDQPSRVALDNIKVELNADTIPTGNCEVEVENTPGEFAVKYFATSNKLGSVTLNGEIRTGLSLVQRAGIFNTYNGIEDITNGNKLSLAAPVEKDYWVAFDVNTQKDYATKLAALLSVGEATLLAVDAESGKLELSDGTDIGNALTATNTVSVAVNIKSDSYDVYLDGALAGSVKNLTFNGGIELNADGVNLRNVKIVDNLISWAPAFGDNITSVAKYAAAPCVTHTAKNGSYKMHSIPLLDGNGGNEGVWSYICSKCGIRVYVEQGIEIMDDSKTTNSDATGVNTTSDTSSYWLDLNKFDRTKEKLLFSYTVDVGSINITGGIKGKGNSGGNFINAMYDAEINGSLGDFNSLLRFYAIKETDGNHQTLDIANATKAAELAAITDEQAKLDYFVKNAAFKTDYGVTASDSVTLNNQYLLVGKKYTNDSMKPLFVIKAGETYEITLEADYSKASNGISLYIDGKLAISGLSHGNWNRLGYFRVFDGYYINCSISNPTFVKYVAEPAHVCTSEYSETTLVTTDTVVSNSYTCYCGERCFDGITNIVKDGIPYITAPTAVAYTAPAGEYWISADAIFAEGQSGTLVTLGNTAVATTADVKSGASLAIKVLGNNYTLYADSVEVKSGAFEGEASVTFGAEGVDAKFAYAKIVQIGATETPLVPVVYGADCKHSDPVHNNCSMIYVNDRPGVKYICDKCGTTVYNDFSYDLMTPITAEMNSYKVYPIYSDDYYKLKGQLAIFSVDFTVKTLPESSKYGDDGRSLLTWFESTVDNTSAYHQFCRIFNAGDDTTRKAEIRLINDGSYKAIDSDLRLEVGKDYRIAVAFDLTSGNYSVYINGEFFGSAHAGLDSGLAYDNLSSYYYVLRFGDGTMGTFSVRNFKLAVNHEHTPASVTSVSLDNLALRVERTCAECKQAYTEYVNLPVVNNISSGINGYKKVDYTAHSGEYWVTTEINMRKQLTGNLLTLGNDVILTADELNVTAPTTVKVVVRVEGKTCDVYVDGKLVKAAVALTEAPASVTYGNGSFGAYVRYNNNKVINNGTIVSYQNMAVSPKDTEYQTCKHTHALGKAVDSITTYNPERSVVTYYCDNCGELVYADLTDSLIDYSIMEPGNGDKNNFNVSSQYTYEGSKFVRVKGGTLSSSSTPYWIKFNLTTNKGATVDLALKNNEDGSAVTTITSENFKSVATNEPNNLTDVRPFKGYGLITIMSSQVFTSELRILPDGWEKDDGAVYVTDKSLTKGTPDGKHGLYVYDADAYREGIKVAELDYKNGSSVDIALYVDPQSGDYDVYIDGVYKCTVTDKAGNPDNSDPKIRVFESGLSKFKINNFVVSREAENFDGKVVAIETKAKFVAPATLPETPEYESLIKIDRVRNTSDRIKDPFMDLLFVNNATGQLAYKETNDKLVPLVDKSGNPICLDANLKNVTVIYDNAANTIRFYVGQYVPYKEVSEGVYEMVGSVKAYNTNFKGSTTRADSVVVRPGSIAYKDVNVYAVTSSGTSEVVGFQSNALTDGIRILSGIDMPWYSSVGYSMQVLDENGKNVTKPSEGYTDTYVVEDVVVYSSVEANDIVISPDKYAHKYFAALTIKDGDKAPFKKDYTLKVTPFTMIGDVRVDGEQVTIKIGDGTYSFVD